ncbi:hypothetical protein QUA41_15150 [Microcoleus sp. Pol11C1]
MGLEYEPTFRFFGETGRMRDRNIVRICDCLHLANRLASILAFRFTPQVNLGT